MRTCGECVNWTPGEEGIGTCSNPPIEPKGVWPRGYNRAEDPVCPDFIERPGFEGKEAEDE